MMLRSGPWILFMVSKTETTMCKDFLIRIYRIGKIRRKQASC
jgi:hypothetical protein